MLAAVVPMKSMDLAKGRLAGVLDAARRRALARQMLEHVLATLRETGLATVHVASLPRHQRPLTTALERARAIALLPYTTEQH